MKSLTEILTDCLRPHQGGRVGRCIACRKPLRWHFDNREVFVGCENAKRPTPKEAK